MENHLQKNLCQLKTPDITKKVTNFYYFSSRVTLRLTLAKAIQEF